MEKTDLVYCTKCGFKNEDDATVCAKCGAPLQISSRERRYRSDDECFGPSEEEWDYRCFGLPHAGTIVALIFGVAIILMGLAIFLGESIWEFFWPFMIITLGLLIIIGALYRSRRRYY